MEISRSGKFAFTNSYWNQKLYLHKTARFYVPNRCFFQQGYIFSLYKLQICEELRILGYKKYFWLIVNEYLFHQESNKGKWSQQNGHVFSSKNKGSLQVHIMIFIISTPDSTRLSNSHVLIKKKFFFSWYPWGTQSKNGQDRFLPIKSKNMIKDAPLFQPAGKKSTLSEAWKWPYRP